MAALKQILSSYLVFEGGEFEYVRNFKNSVLLSAYRRYPAGDFWVAVTCRICFHLPWSIYIVWLCLLWNCCNHLWHNSDYWRKKRKYYRLGNCTNNRWNN